MENQEIWQMTYHQYCLYWREHSKYGEEYKGRKDMWEAKKRDLLVLWVRALEQRATEGDIPERVMRSYVNIFGRQRTMMVFRGRAEKGLGSWYATDKKRVYRSKRKF